MKEREGQLDAVIIDHPGLVVSDRSSTAYERASANAIGTKQLARRLDTVVGSIVQANRGAAKDTERAPAALESTRDSGCWEENADFVLALSQLIEKPGRQPHVGRLQKNRRGPNVSLALGFDPKTLRMAEVDEAGGDQQ